jgi:hypothetical protein
MAIVTAFSVRVVEFDLFTLEKLAPPLVETIHRTLGVGEPDAAALKLAFDPALTLTLIGFEVTTGADDEAAPAKVAVKNSDARLSENAPANTRPLARRTFMATPHRLGNYHRSPYFLDVFGGPANPTFDGWLGCSCSANHVVRETLVGRREVDRKEPSVRIRSSTKS